MQENEFAKNVTQFIRELKTTPSPTEPIDTLKNIWETIKDYREFSEPFSPKWEQYIQNVFHVLGFNTMNESKRLILLTEMGGARTKKAILAIIGEYETFNEIISGISWPTFLKYAANYHQVDWAILTDGNEIRIFNRKLDMSKVILRGNLEQIIADEGFDGFFALSEIMSLIRGKPIPLTIHRLPINDEHTGDYILDNHLTNKSNLVISLFEELRSKIFSLNDQIHERIRKMYIGYYNPNSFCQVRIYKKHIKIWVNVDIHEISDPYSIARDVRKIGHYGTGNTELTINTFDDLGKVFRNNSTVT
jgi:predicted transport protein